ncbi:MAG: NitT/TauT family transport system substrate-binding protein [Rhodothermales bacterium]|jgi:NitT/TauT family transport system substrate-binding protein
MPTRTGKLLILAIMLGALLVPASMAAPLKIAYSDWPGWVAWEVAIQKGFFKEADADVEFIWFEYVPSMDAFAASKVDACCMTNGDALVIGSSGKACKGILLNDYSNGNDMVVGRPGIRKIKQLKGKKVGVEVGFVGHLLLLKALEANGLKESDVTLVNVATHETPQVLASKSVDAIVAWQPNSGQALKQVPGSRTLFSSADAPGIIYDLLYVSNESLSKKKAEWAKVVAVWDRTVRYIRDEKNRDEVLKIMSGRVGLTPEEYAPLLEGTFLLLPEEAKPRQKKGDGFHSVYGSSAVVDKFNVDNKVYDKGQKIENYLDFSLTQ